MSTNCRSLVEVQKTIPVLARQQAAQQSYRAHSATTLAGRDQLILQELPMVRYIAKRIHDRLPPSVLLDDLIHTGILGLMEAIQHYDPGKHVDLGAYAKHRIRGAILDSLRDLDWGSRQLRRKGRELDEARDRLQAKLGRTAEEMELAKEAGFGVDELRQLQENLLRLVLSTIHEQEVDSEKGESLEQQPASAEFDPFSVCLRGEVQELLQEAIGELPERERQGLALYYYEELTMKEVGMVLGVGEARVSQLHTAATLRLRGFLEGTMASRREPLTFPPGKERLSKTSLAQETAAFQGISC